METTPRRIYNLRGSHRPTSVRNQSKNKTNGTFSNAEPLTCFRKRLSDVSDDGKNQKRQRTYQTTGPEFPSPDGTIPSRTLQFEESRVIPQFSARQPEAQQTPYGLFGRLPYDSAFQLLSRTPYNLLGSMAMTSNAWMEKVYSYVHSGSFRVRWLDEISQTVSDSRLESTQLQFDPFFSMGLLIRKMTFNHVWDARVAILQSFIKLAQSCGAKLLGVSRMIQAFAERPDNDIITEHIDDLITMGLSLVPRLNEQLNDVMSRTDVDRQLMGNANMDIHKIEFNVRRSITELFLSFGSTDPSAGLNKFFLSSLMRRLRLTHGALPTPFFYLLFSPTTIHGGVEVINWHRFSQLSVNNFNDAQELSVLSKALYALLLCRNLKNTLPWTKNSIFNLMEEITTYPSPWSMNTFVALQVLQPELLPIGVIARMHRNHEDEAGDMICTMKTLLHRWKMDVIGVMQSVIEVIRNGLKPPQRRSLFDRCWDWHQRNIDDLRARLGRSEDILSEIESQIEVMPVLLKLL